MDNVPEKSTEKPADLNVVVENKADNTKTDTWRVYERVGVAVILLVLLGNHFMRQDSAKQSYIQTAATEAATQAKLDRQEERLAAQRTQEELVKVITSQVTATVAQTAEQKESRATQEQVVGALDRFSTTAETFVDRLDKHLDNIEAQK